MPLGMHTSLPSRSRPVGVFVNAEQRPRYDWTQDIKKTGTPARRREAKVAAGQVSSDISATDVKRKLEKLAGSKHGLDKSDEEKKAVAEVASQLESLERIDEIDMTGSRWALVFTESTASSSGKVGPFIGRTEQEFPKDKPGQYINWLYLGPVTASLLADYKQVSPDRIDVSFLSLTVKAGPFKWDKEFKNRGTWDSMYIDDQFRVFRANKKNIFVLKKIG